MQTIRVRTTQNVFIEYPLASVGERIAAYLIDWIILDSLHRRYRCHVRKSGG